jgi:hypothetical protein
MSRTPQPRPRPKASATGPTEPRRLSYEERDRAKTLWAHGSTVSAIAEELGCAVADVSFVMHTRPPLEVRATKRGQGTIR